jgi:hypothetical protein
MPTITDNQIKNIHDLVDLWIKQSVETGYLPVMMVSLREKGEIKIFSVIEDNDTLSALFIETIKKLLIGDYTKTVNEATFKEPSEG